MGSRYDGKRINVEGDRLSNLPDDLIHKILSLIDIKQAIETSALSSRWRYIWTSMPCLNFSNRDFQTLTKFSKFVISVMSGRNNQTEVSSVNLSFHGKISQSFVKKNLNIILNCESCHNVQHLNITDCSYGKMIEVPLSLFSLQSLKHLTLTGCTYGYPITITSTWELWTLTTLNLRRVSFNNDKFSGLFSNFANLKNLTLSDCRIGPNEFSICHPGVSNLTLEDGREGGNVVTPQLKNLTIRHWQNMLMISAPNLASLYYKDRYECLQLSADLLHLEKADISIFYPSEEKAKARKIVCLLQQLSSVKFLTLSLEICKILSSSLELISHQPSPFAKLKSLKVYPAYVTAQKQAQPEVLMSTEVKNYLLDGSPSATFTVVSHEEIRAKRNVASARKIMGKLHVLLDQWKENSETNIEVENQLDTTMKWDFWNRMTHINEEFKKGSTNIDRAITLLREIEGVLTMLPASDEQAKLQASFASLSAEVETRMGVVVDHLKIHCDKKPTLFHELATTSDPSC